MSAGTDAWEMPALCSHPAVPEARSGRVVAWPSRSFSSSDGSCLVDLNTARPSMSRLAGLLACPGAARMDWLWPVIIGVWIIFLSQRLLGQLAASLQGRVAGHTYRPP